MKFLFRCKYCSNVFEDFFYTEDGAKDARCPRCKDTNLDQIDESQRDPFGYKKDKK